MAVTLDTLYIEIQHIKKQQEEVGEKIEEISRSLKGNGSPGLNTRMALLEEAQASRWRHVSFLWGAFLVLLAAVLAF